MAISLGYKRHGFPSAADLPDLPRLAPLLGARVEAPSNSDGAFHLDKVVRAAQCAADVNILPMTMVTPARVQYRFLMAMEPHIRRARRRDGDLKRHTYYRG